jgi:MFS family permease
MGLYAFFLAGSNFFAPVICGFIAQYQGWQWVFYWPSIFIGCAMIFLFFFMEETNYVRDHIEDTTIANVRVGSSHSSQSSDPEKAVPKAEPVSTETGDIYTMKTYVQKLALLGPKQKQNTMFRRLRQTLYYLSWPVILYAGYAIPLLHGCFTADFYQILLRIVLDFVQYP